MGKLIIYKKNNWQISFIKNLLFVTTLFLFVSCNLFYNKDAYIKKFSNFIEDVNTNNRNYTDEDWKNAELKYKEFSEKEYIKFRNDFTESDKELIGKLKSSYQIIKVKKETKNILEDAKDVVYQIKGAIEGVSDSISN